MRDFTGTLWSHGKPGLLYPITVQDYSFLKFIGIVILLCNWILLLLSSSQFPLPPYATFSLVPIVFLVKLHLHCKCISTRPSLSYKVFHIYIYTPFVLSIPTLIGVPVFCPLRYISHFSSISVVYIILFLALFDKVFPFNMPNYFHLFDIFSSNFLIIPAFHVSWLYLYSFILTLLIKTL